MKRRRTVAWLGLAILLAASGLVACSSDSDDEVIHVEVGAVETQGAQTATAEAFVTATPGSTPTATPLPTPYTIPENPSEMDGDTVITRVGSQEITLDQFRAHVRFERWRYLYQIARLAEKHGTERILDLRLEENWYVSSVFATLADSNSFGNQIHRIMTIDAISFDEALRRGLEVDPYQFDAKLAEYIGLTVGEGGSLPPEFDEVYADFLEGMYTYSGLTEEDFRRIVRARTLYSQLQFLISNQPESIPSTETARVGLQVQDILVNTLAEAEEVIVRLVEGEDLYSIAVSLGYTPSSDDVSRVVRWSDENLTAEVITALKAADVGDIIGPYAVSQGWYVAVVGTEVFDTLSPDDIDALREQYFLDWIENKMDDPELVEDFNNWQSYIPQEPLPRDVSPLLVEENVILPEGADSSDPYGIEGDE